MYYLIQWIQLTCWEGAEDTRVINAYQIESVSHHHITAWRGSIITVLAAKFKNAYRGRSEG